MGWKQAEEAAEKAKGGKFIRLENDGDKVTVALPFCGPNPDDEPVVRDVIWDDKEEKQVPFSAEHKQAGKEPMSRFLFNAYDAEADELRILEIGVSTFKELLAARDKYGMDKFYEIRRFGAARSKKTKYKILFDSDISEAQKARITELSKEKHDLSLDHDSDTKQKKTATTGTDSSSSLISEAAVADLLPKLKALPDERRRAFLTEFAIKKARDLKSTDLERANKWINGGATVAAPVKEDDAFA